MTAKVTIFGAMCVMTFCLKSEKVKINEQTEVYTQLQLLEYYNYSYESYEYKLRKED